MSGARPALIVPFHLGADLTGGVRADIAGELGVLQHLDLDHAAAGIAGSALLGADIDTRRHIAAAFDGGRAAASRVCRPTRAATDREPVEPPAAANVAER